MDQNRLWYHIKIKKYEMERERESEREREREWKYIEDYIVLILDILYNILQETSIYREVMSSDQ